MIESILSLEYDFACHFSHMVCTDTPKFIIDKVYKYEILRMLNETRNETSIYCL